MRDHIDRLLARGEPLKAREIARELGFDRSDVNSFLYANRKLYIKDDDHRWSLSSSGELELTLPDEWVDADSFENMLRAAGAILDGHHASVRICFPSAQCKPLIDCTARLLALANQLVDSGKSLTLDFTNAWPTLSYYNRVGFFDLLDARVIVLPNRPVNSAAKIYQGQSDSLVELGAVNPSGNNADLIDQLVDRFVQQTSSNSKTIATTIFGELIGNVKEHSRSSLFGFAGSQQYNGSRKHIQTVVTDSGVGIARTLRPALEEHYPALFEKFGKESLESDIGLVAAAMKTGGISRFGRETGRGLGFESSRKQATKLNASLSVRQEEFCVRFIYQNGALVKLEKQRGLSKIQGTHICFDFYVD